MSLDHLQQEDSIGLETLEMFARADKFNEWMYEAIAPFCQGTILEIGSGIGNISKYLLENNEGLTALSDLRENYCTILRQRFANRKNLKGIFQIDLSTEDFAGKYTQLLNQFDTVIALNVIEHINNDQLAIKNCNQLLKKNGRLIILVPAYKSLYNSLDKELGHFRRYTSRKLRDLLINQGMKMVAAKYFNGAGIFGWWVSGSIFKNKIISDKQLAIYNNLVPAFRLADKLIFNIMGLSVIAVAEK